MLLRSFGTQTFAGFWQHWNPIWGYYLGKYVFVPLRTLFPNHVSVVLTFVVCGLIHDLVIMAVRQDVVFLFTPWFFFLGISVVLGKLLRVDFAAYAWGGEEPSVISRF